MKYSSPWLWSKRQGEVQANREKQSAGGKPRPVFHREPKTLHPAEKTGLLWRITCESRRTDNVQLNPEQVRKSAAPR
jgi:ribosomal protein L44E